MDTLFFIASKLFWLIAAPDSLLLLMLLAGVLCLFGGRRRAGKVLTALPAVLFLLIALLPLDEWLALPLESRFPANPALPPSVDGIIMLGGPLMAHESVAWQQLELSATAERYTALAKLARVFPEATVVISGGSGGLTTQHVSEAEQARELLHDLGLNTSRVLFEKQSRNTYENVVNSRQLARPEAGERWVLVTSAAHMPRAMGIFCAQGWPVIPYPVDHNTSPGRMLRVEFSFADNLALLAVTTREWAGLTVYRLAGRTSSLFPSGCAGG